ncbi:murein hydrolase activator EnvC [Acaryochloris sp. CCMEE 5410]|uniref:murein hydrolase activator EnvC family protein n=1 Tax=Acaryochloris sp. CCMEE 5410 TaxID=310037 RepID=UPI001112264D|nr:peptidoglycan DD-metalloendopeptidase family protein [Acaryochloris sp. CCMEE 5410]KAI9132653.1 peptidoglycan DD-metalloendopeptidase family protein [Acaryochloris sp. CCMEE 5410]
MPRRSSLHARSKKGNLSTARDLTRIVGVIVGLCLAVFLFTLSEHPSFAQNSSDLNELQERRIQVEEQRSKVTKQRQQIENLEGAAKKRLGGLERNIQFTEGQIKENEAKLKQANETLQKIEADLTKAETAYKEKQGNTVARLRVLQRQRDSSTWVALLQSKSIEELLDRRYQLQLVYKSDRTSLLALKDEKEKINDKKLLAEIQKNQISLLSEQLLYQKANFKAQASVQSQLVTRLKSDRRALQAAEQQLSRDVNNISQVIAQRIAEQQVAFRSNAPGVQQVFGTGQMVRPVVGPITSNFGYRSHPIFGTGRFHAGTDFGAPTGAPIFAADSGTVIVAEWYGGYGNAVIIDHGNGLTTLYGHCNELYVTVGQGVQRGQTIAAVGSTGLSTGPHLHFEVRVQGEPTEPLAYL